jgi:acyl carrier protein
MMISIRDNIINNELSVKENNISPGSINMDYQTIRKEIIDIIADIAVDKDLSDLDDNVKLKAQLRLNAKDFLDVVTELKKRYSIEVPVKDYRKLATIRSCIEYLSPRL